MYYGYLKTQIGILKLVTSSSCLYQVTLVFEEGESKICSFLLQCIKEIEEYFLGVRKQFTISICFSGTEFQKKVWNVLLGIPYGQTITYLEVAKKIGRPTASRAVGNAIHHNPILIVVPCHRVIPKTGGVGGFAYGSIKKEQLLFLERKYRDDLVT